MKELQKQALSAFETIEKRDGVLAPKMVVEEARPGDSPIHSLFEWDDTVAGEEHRIWQARQYIKKVKLVVKDKKVRKYYNVRIVKKNHKKRPIVVQGYVSSERVFSDKELKNQVRGDLIKRQRYWFNRAKDFEELINIIDVGELVKVEKKYL